MIGRNGNGKNALIRWLHDLRQSDLPLVGGKNASLGEMLGTLQEKGVRVPPGFAITVRGYWSFVEENGLQEKIAAHLDALAPDRSNLAAVGRAIRDEITSASMPDGLAAAIGEAFVDLQQKAGRLNPPLAVRSSATAEDLPEASFAGQLDTYLNVRGERQLVDAVQRCFASLFTDRVITYREEHGFDHLEVGLSVGVQLMVRSDKGGSGVMFSLDTESGFRETVLINAAWGLGEAVVQGAADPDEYVVFKRLLGKGSCRPIVEKQLGAKAHKMVNAPRGPRMVDTTPREQGSFVLSDDEILQLARWACDIEDHYGSPMDMEWAKDGETGELFVVQARPETVHSRPGGADFKQYTIRRKGDLLASGHAIGDAVATGVVCRLQSPEELGSFVEGSVLVTEMTDPDWLPAMRKASAIVTDHGGRTSHAAIVSRELGLPAVVGTGDATRKLTHGSAVTVSCAEGDRGFVYEGVAEFEVEDLDLSGLPETRTKIMLNLAEPAAAFRWWRLPADGVGLARMEFIINNMINVHPMALVRFDEIEDPETRQAIERATRGYESMSECFVDKLGRGLARIAAAHHPNRVIVRMSDFKSNEYARLVGGEAFEPEEENPMLGWRGASRYYSDGYREGFALECRAIRRAREVMGLDNIVVMIPFCRTVREADLVLEELAKNGLRRGEKGLVVYMMCEIPSNVILAEEFAKRFDGFSIGSNDLTQMVLGVDRDSGRLADLFDESNEAVKSAIASVLERLRGTGTSVGLCGQAPSDNPEFARFLVQHGIDSISVTPDSFFAVKTHVAAAEREHRVGEPQPTR